MGKHSLRQDTDCLNCGHTVEHHYCSRCGQKNTESRQSFGHLLAHFVEDLTHYDTAFWKTIKYLLFRPARLTKEYLAGKRTSYVPPVKLYIFISFITFFIPSLLLPIVGTTNAEEIEPTQAMIEADGIIRRPTMDGKEPVWFPSTFGWHNYGFYIQPIGYRSEREMDSIENIKPASMRLTEFERKLALKQIKLHNRNTPYQVGEKLAEALPHNIPKALFIYMPIFAFILWLFHGKRRWYFFDHGIFTLHYFSFLMLSVTLAIIVISLLILTDTDWAKLVSFFFGLGVLFWQVYYFYRAHRKMYGEGFLINFLKSTMMFLINFVAIIILMLVLMGYTYLNLH